MGLLPLSIKVGFRGTYLERKIYREIKALDGLLHINMLSQPYVMQSYSYIMNEVLEDMKGYEGGRYYKRFERKLKDVDNTERLFTGWDQLND